MERNHNPFENYIPPQYDAILKSPLSRPLPKQEEHDLACKMLAGNKEAKARLVQANLKFIVSLAQEVYPYVRNFGVTFMDLVALGNASLSKSLDNYDPYDSRCAGVCTYVARTTRFQMKDLGAYGRSTIRLPRSANLYSVHLLGWDSPAYGDSGLNLSEVISNPDDVGVLEQVTIKQDYSRALALLNTRFDEETREMVYLRFGLEGHEPLLLGEIGKKFKISREAVRLRINKALKKVKLNMH